MGYDGSMFLAAVVLLLPMLLVAGALVLVGQRLRLLPGGRAEIAVGATSLVRGSLVEGERLRMIDGLH